MKYTCLLCNKNFPQKSNYLSHQRRKNPCNTNNNDNNTSVIKTIINSTILPQNSTILPQNSTILPQNSNNLECLYCHKKYSRKDALNRHISNYCKNIPKNKINDVNNTDNTNKTDIIVIKQKIDELEEENQKLKEENLKLKEENLMVVSKKKYTNNKTNINNNIQNQTNIQTQNNIIINTVNFGEEDMDLLTETELLSCFKSLSRSFNNFIKMVHLNDRLPEFSNILINNLRSEHGSIYDEGKFISKSKNKIIADLISTRVSDIEVLGNRYRNQRKISNKEHEFVSDIVKFIKTNQEDENIDGTIIKCDKSNARRMKEIHKELLYLFYDNKNIVIKNIDKIKEIKENKILDV